MAISVPRSERWTTRLRRRIVHAPLILAIVLVVMAVLFLIAYGVGIQHHHATTNQGAMSVVTTMW
ncbi:MAG: hypothetical protein ACR2GA_03260 [Chloroflexota bacterium]